jgi:hypothetical protein
MQYSLCFINFKNSFDSSSVTGLLTSNSWSTSTPSLPFAFLNSSGVKHQPLQVIPLILVWNEGTMTWMLEV